MAHPPANSASGMALFSTRNGKHAQRQAPSNMSIVIRSDPVEDRNTMTARLLAEFPGISKAITTFTPVVGDYFDGYDQELHGFEFLRAVLLHIAAINASEARRVQDYVRRWMATNKEAFEMLTPEHTCEHLFTEEDFGEYGKEFLGDAAMQIKHIKDQASHNDAARESMRLQQQHDRMANAHRKFVLLHTPPYSPHPSNLSAFQNSQAISTPQQTQGPLEQGMMRSSPTGQVEIHNGRHPQEHLNPSFGALGHVHTGAGLQSNIHSDSSHRTMGTFHSPNMNYCIAVPSPGLPGFSGIESPMRAPTTHRHQNYKNNQPKGRKNPVKRSSDDARRGSFEPETRYQTSSRRRSSQLGTFQFVQSPQSMFSSVQPPINPSQPPSNIYTSTDGSFWDGQQQRHTSDSELRVMHSAAFPSAEYVGQQLLMSTRINQSSHHTIASSSTEPEHPMPFKDVPEITSSAPETVHLGPPVSNVGRQQSPNESVPSAISFAPEADGQSLDSSVFVQQIPAIRLSFPDPQSMTSGIGLAPGLSMSDQDQDQDKSRNTPQCSTNQDSPNRVQGFIKGPKIWVGGIPVNSSRTAVWKMLESCQGLSDITDPRNQGSHTHTYVFAEFRTELDAEEALNRIAQNHIPSLPEGSFLIANWPHKRDSTPKYQQRKGKANLTRDTPQISPFKNREADTMEDNSVEESGKAKLHYRRRSGNAASRETPLSSAKDGTGLPNTHATAVNPVEPSDLKPSPGPTGWVRKSASITEEEVLRQTKKTPGSPDPLSEGKGKGLGSRHMDVVQPDPGINSAKPTFTQTTKANIDPSTIGCASDSGQADTVPSTNEAAQKSKTGHSDGQTASSTLKKANKKKKNRNHESKASNHLQKSNGGQFQGGIRGSKGIEPLSKSQANPIRKTFLENAALPEHEDDAANVHEAETNIPESSAAAESPRATAGSGAQQVPGPSLMAISCAEPPNLKITEHPRLPITDPPLVTPPAEDQSQFAKLNAGKIGPYAITGSDPFATAKTIDGGKQQQPQAITQDASSPTYAEDGSTSFAQSSTAQTSYFHTERSNNISDRFPPNHASINELIGSASIPQGQNPGSDAARLSSLLQADGNAQAVDEHAGNIDSIPEYVHAEQATTTIPDVDTPSQEWVHAKYRAQPTSISPDGVTRVGHTMREPTSSIEVAMIDVKPNSSEKSSPFPPNKQFEQSPILTVSDRSAPDLQIRAPEELERPTIPPRSSSLKTVEAPIETRRKKKPKHFTPVEGKESDAKVPSTQADMSPDDEDKDSNEKLDSSYQAKLQTLAQGKTSKQKKSPKHKSTKDKNNADLAIKSSLRTPIPDRSRLLPKPETPFQTDSGVSLPIVPVSKPTAKDCNKIINISAQYNNVAHAELNGEGRVSRSVEDLSDNDFYSGSLFSSLPSDSAILEVTPLRSSAHGQEGIESALEEAGYHLSHTPCSSRHFAVEDPLLTRLEQAIEMEEQRHEAQRLGNANSSKGVMDRVEDLKKQFEVTQLCEQAAAARKLQTGLPPRTPTKTSSRKQKIVEDPSSIELLEGGIEKIAAQLISAKAIRGEKEVGNSAEDRNIEKASILLKLSPRRIPTSKDGREWSMMATQYIGENTIPQNSLPSTPTRRTGTSNNNRPTTSPNSPFGKQEKLMRGSPVLSDRPCSLIMTRPGSATALVPLRRGEDASKIISRYDADPDAFFGFGKTPGSNTSASLESSHQTSSESELALTPPPSPQIVGHDTPSQERKKRIPSPPSLRQSRQSAKHLESVFVDMKNTTSSTMNHGTTVEPYSTDSKENVSAQSAIALHELQGGDVVCQWGQNSGARDVEVQYEAQVEDDRNADRRISRGDHDDIMGLHDCLSTLPEVQNSNDQKKSKEKRIHVAHTEIEKEQFRPSIDCIVGDVETDQGKPVEKQRGVKGGASTTHREPQVSDGVSSAVDSPIADSQMIQSSSQRPEILESGIENPSEAGLEIDFPTSKSFVVGSDGTIFAKNDQDDTDYPVLTHGRHHSLKGGKSTSPTRGGYAAVAAKKKEGSEEEKQEAKLVKKPTNSDGWAVDRTEAWGSGRGNNNRKQRNDT